MTSNPEVCPPSAEWHGPKTGTSDSNVLLPPSDYRKQFADECSRYVESFSTLRVLVVGCGLGLDCHPFVHFGAKAVHGIDMESGVGREFRHPSVTYVRAAAEALPFAEFSYDVVFSVATMEHIHDIEGAFREMIRVTKPAGLIFCVAAPLWNSREGHHHFGLFPDYPWIHLPLAQDDILHCCRDRNIAKGDYDVSYDVAFMFSDYFNTLPARRYLEVCAGLPVSELIDNSLWLEPDEHLTQDILAELDAQGYTREELLAVSHTFVARR
jgi:SAM-dependent methyltransferase